MAFCKKWSTFNRPHSHITHFWKLCIFLLMVRASINKTQLSDRRKSHSGPRYRPIVIRPINWTAGLKGSSASGKIGSQLATNCCGNSRVCLHFRYCWLNGLYFPSANSWPGLSTLRPPSKMVIVTVSIFFSKTSTPFQACCPIFWTDHFFGFSRPRNVFEQSPFRP